MPVGGQRHLVTSNMQILPHSQAVRHARIVRKIKVDGVDDFRGCLDQALL